MSNAVSALQGATFDGIATVKEAGLVGMITIRGDFADMGFAKAVKGACGLTVPGQRGVERAGGAALIWMSPDELLLVVAHDVADEMVAALDAGFGDLHAMAVNVSDARAVFDVSGGQAADVLAKVMPVDFSRDGLPEGMVRRSRLAQVPAAVWREGADGFRVVCFRSAAVYVFGVLGAAAAEGSEVGLLG